MSENTTLKNKRGRPAGTGAVTSDAVRQTRLALGLNQQEMAAEIGCALSSIARMEQLRKLPSKGAVFNNFEKLAKKAGIQLEVSA